jgi:hypothetical protein
VNANSKKELITLSPSPLRERAGVRAIFLEIGFIKLI